MYGIYVGFVECDATGKRLWKAFTRDTKESAEALFDSIVSECHAKMVDATIDLIHLDAGERLQRETVDESANRRAWSEFFPPILGVRTY